MLGELLEVEHRSFLDQQQARVSINHAYFFLCHDRYKVVRGALDLGGVAGRTTSRSKYGGV